MLDSIQHLISDHETLTRACELYEVKQVQCDNIQIFYFSNNYLTNSLYNLSNVAFKSLENPGCGLDD